jgi:hypothetical protein
MSTSGVLTGYAWSNNIGWIRFGGLSSFPTAAGTTAANASVTGTYPNLTFQGWARACAGTTSAVNTCGTMTSRTDGWDGWISLRQTVAPVHNVFTAGGTYPNNGGVSSPSYAWGGDVIGWIDMASVAWDAPTASVTGVTCVIPLGSDTCNGTLSWTMLPNTILNPTIYQTVPTPATTLFSTRVGTSTVALKTGSNIFQARTGSTMLATRTLTPTCIGASVVNVVTGNCENAPPVISIVANNTIVRNGSQEPITWTITGLLDGSCSVNGNGISVAATTTGGTLNSGPLTNFSRFTMVCTGSFGEVSASDEVEVVPRSQEV